MGPASWEALRASVVLNLLLALFLAAAPRRVDPGPSANWHGIKSAFSATERPWASEEEWTAFPKDGLCGSWAGEYTRFHAAARQAPANDTKYIVYRPDTSKGLGDRINGMIATFLAALVSKRAFFVHPSALSSFDGAFEPAEIDWHPTSDVPIDITTRDWRAVTPGCVISVRWMNMGRDLTDLVRFPVHIVETFEGLENARSVDVETNAGILTHIFRTEDSLTRVALERMGIRMPYAFACLMRYLLRPRPEVWSLVQKPLAVMQQPRVTSVCVHMRTTDAFSFWSGGMGGQKDFFVVRAKRLVQCAKGVAVVMAPATHQVKVLFLSDATTLLPRLTAAYPGLIIDSGIKAEHVSHEDKKVQAALADWLLFSRCQYYMLVESGFSKTSSAYNILKPYRFLMGGRFDVGVDLNLHSCQTLEPVPLLEFHSWSGL